MDTKRTVFLILSVFIVSCSTDQESEVQKVEISSKIVQGPIEDIVESFEIVELDTCKKAFFNFTDKITFKNKKYYVKTYTDLLIFAEDGKLLTAISKQGRGPGEYTSLNDFYIEDDNNRIVMSSRDKALIFSEHGELIGEKKWDFTCHSMHKTQDGSLLIEKRFPSDVKSYNYNLILTDSNFKIIDKRISLPLVDGPGLAVYGQLYRTHSNFERDYHFSLSSDTVYLIKNGKIIPDIVFSYDRKTFTFTNGVDEIDRNNVYSQLRYGELENHRLLSFSIDRNGYLAVIEKDTGEVRVYKGYLEISNIDRNSVIMHIDPGFLSAGKTLYDPEKCINRKVYERVMAKPENSGNLIVKVSLDL